MTEKVSLRLIFNKDTWTLTLRDVQTSDRGPYMCQVNSTPVRSQVKLLLVYPRIMSYVCSLGCSPGGGDPTKDRRRAIQQWCSCSWGGVSQAKLQGRRISKVRKYSCLSWFLVQSVNIILLVSCVLFSSEYFFSQFSLLCWESSNLIFPINIFIYQHELYIQAAFLPLYWVHHTSSHNSGQIQFTSHLHKLSSNNI